MTTEQQIALFEKVQNYRHAVIGGAFTPLKSTPLHIQVWAIIQGKISVDSAFALWQNTPIQLAAQYKKWLENKAQHAETRAHDKNYY